MFKLYTLVLLALLCAFNPSNAQFQRFDPLNNLAYQFVDGALVAIDVNTQAYGTNIIQPINGNSDPFSSLNAGGFNDVDSLIYGLQHAGVREGGIDPNHLIRFSANGLVQDLGHLNKDAYAATFVGDDYWFAGGDSLCRIPSVSTLTPNPTGSVSYSNYPVICRSPDLATIENANGTFLVGVSSQTRKIEVINITNTGAVTKVIKRVRNFPKGHYGAAWAGTDGRLYVINNATGRLYEIKNVFKKPFAVHVMTLPSVAQNDGMSSRFVVLLSADLLSLETQVLDKQVALTWELTQDALEGLLHFELERSTDGITFQTIGRKEVAAVTSYAFLDEKPMNGVNYYRIKYTNEAQNIFYSPIVTATVLLEDKLVVYPNPAVSQLNLKGLTSVNGPLTIRLYSILGQPIKQKVIAQGFGAVALNVADIDNGCYILHVYDATGLVCKRQLRIAH